MRKIEWIYSDEPVGFEEAGSWMEKRVSDIISGKLGEAIWLLEHPSIYTAGTSARKSDLLTANRFPVFKTGRGGQYTYHGPGQRIVYLMLDLNQRGRDVRKFVSLLEHWIISTLLEFNVTGTTHSERVGVWVNREKELGPGREDKIASIGIRLRRWVSFHGISINVDPDLEHFSGIIPCGIDPEAGTHSGLGVTSLTDLGLPVTMSDLDLALKKRAYILES